MTKDEQVDRNGFVLQNSWRQKVMLAFIYIDVTNDVQFKLTIFGVFLLLPLFEGVCQYVQLQWEIGLLNKINHPTKTHMQREYFAQLSVHIDHVLSQ